MRWYRECAMELQPIAGGRRRLHILFMAAVGLLGWCTLIAAYALPGLPPGGEDGTLAAPLPVVLFLVVIVAARGMAFPLFPKTVVSLDGAFYVAATLCLGSVTAGILVAIALTLDASVRRVHTRDSRALAARDRLDSIAYVVFFGGMSGALLMISAWLFRADGALLGPEMDHLDVLFRVVGIGVTLLLLHYGVQAARLKIIGESIASFFRRTTLPGIVAEASLLPLAAVVVYLYDPDRPLGFSLLGATYLLINFALSRLTRTSDQLRHRVGELETLNAIARQLAASLERQELVTVVARETLRAIPQADSLTLARLDDDGHGELVLDHYERGNARFERIRAPAEGSAPARVLEVGEPLSIPDLDYSAYFPACSARRGSWVGIPMVMYGGVEGVIAIHSARPGALGAEQRQLLEAIGAQATVALQNARLYELAMVDGLTGLFVRRYFDARREEEIERARRYDTSFSVVMLDIDNFKALNDTHGHQAGDRVLRRLAAAVKREMRAVDTAARYGGEEIAMLLPRTSAAEAYQVADRVRAAIAGCEQEAGLVVTASLGVASYPECGASDSDELLARADRALYRAKRAGKNRVETDPPGGKELGAGADRGG